MARRGSGRRGGGQGLLTILFTDLSGSTALTQRLGDARAQEVVRAHNAIVRREVQDRGGTEIKHTGDGIMATFPSAARAVASAVAIQRGVRTYGETHPEMAFAVKIGLNAGEPVAEDADVFGTAVQMAARTCAEASGGQILATNVVRELVFGKGALFADAGTARMKGFDEPVHLFEVGIGEAGIDEGADLRRRPLLRWIAAGALALAIVAAGAVALVLALSGGDDAGAGDAPAYRELRSDVSFESALTVLGGDCVSSDLRIKGVSTGTWAGDVSGSHLVDSDVSNLVAEGCRTTRITSTEAVADDGGNSITGRSFSIVTARLREGRGKISAGLTSDLWTVGVITGGTGLYADAAGTFTCDLLATVQEALRSLADGECVVRLLVESPPPLIMAVAAERESIGVSLNTKQEPDTTRIYGVYRNTTTATISGARMRLVTGNGVEALVDDANPAGSDPSDARGWDIPPIPAGETAYFDITMRLRSAESDAIDVAIEVKANGLSEPALSDPITLEVVR